MKIKKCSCGECKHGIRTKSESENVKYQVQSARHTTKQKLHVALKADLDTLLDICDNLDTFVGIDYTD